MSELSTHRLITDYAAFSTVADSERAKVLDRLDWVNRIHNAPAGGKGLLVTQASSRLGVSKSAVNRYLKRFREQGWEGLVDGRARGNTERGLPTGFKQWVAGMHLSKQGRWTTGKEVERLVIAQWNKWSRTRHPDDAIPGYDSPPPACPRTGYPVGWSYDQIARRLRPTGRARIAAAQGEKAANKLLPSVRKSRADVGYGAVVYFDDDEPDIKVVVPGKSLTTVRPQCLTCVDYLTGYIPQNHIRLRIRAKDAKGKETGKVNSLTIVEATWFVLGYLLNHGYRTDQHGTTLVVEWGTMNTFANDLFHTLSGHSSFEDAIKAVTQGCVKIDRSGRINKPQFAEMLFAPGSSGNPNYKSPVESLFNLVRNRMVSSRGQIGLNRDMTPAERYSIEKNDESLLKLYEKLPDHLKPLVKFEHLTPVEFGQFYLAAFQAINDDPDHNLKNWAQCGFEVPVFRWSEHTPWMSREQVAYEIGDDEDMHRIYNRKMELPGHTKLQRLSRSQAREMFTHELTKLRPELVPLVLPKEWAKPCTIQSNNTITFRDQLIDSEPFEYVAAFKGRDSMTTLNTGTRIMVYFNPLNPDTIYCTDSDGRWLGTLTRWTDADYYDQQAIDDQLHEVSRMRSHLDTAIRPAQQGIAKARQDRRDHNDDLRKQAQLPTEQGRGNNSKTGARKNTKRTPADILAERAARRDAEE